MSTKRARRPVVVALDQIDHVARRRELRAGRRGVGSGDVHDQAVAQDEPDRWRFADFERADLEWFSGLGPGLRVDRRGGNDQRDDEGCNEAAHGSLLAAFLPVVTRCVKHTLWRSSMPRPPLFARLSPDIDARLVKRRRQRPGPRLRDPSFFATICEAVLAGSMLWITRSHPRWSNAQFVEAIAPSVA